MIETIKYERNWCDYFTKCPYLFKEQAYGPFVGDYECSVCPFNCELNDTERIVKCDFREKIYEEKF